ncbi:hypothetical protein ONS95_012989 [Cadophora gregata]|uniref:uncharacterized protein n=1 Tax=Cadophora gregata TaxID=51156 RepID=UPI0026DB74DA|nr:uncharacterized protein ONS95_012989 [Cadophora gregata]KAK0101023.1 hypothetical protein ONS96_006254 [Cadophora gregata f. sp. sojae]KAK0115947.1 hypothetical protein ONS95_012989 [Cadophora gregata]
MMFFKSAIAFSALLAVASAMSVVTLNRDIQFVAVDAVPVSNMAKSSFFAVSGSVCDKEDEADCKEFCGLSEQTATCTANGNKVTCSCKGGKSESNCEERCLLCMPDKSSLDEASRLFKLGGTKMEL